MTGRFTWPCWAPLGLWVRLPARNADYASEVAPWEDTARKSPDKARVQNNRGFADPRARS